MTEPLVELGEDYLKRFVAGILLIGMLLVVLPFAVLVFAATGVVFVAINAVLGTPTGTAAAVLGVGWFVGSLVLLVGLIVLAYRRTSIVRRVIRSASGSSRSHPATSTTESERARRDPEADRTTFLRRVRAADARLADNEDESPVQPDEEPGDQS